VPPTVSLPDLNERNGTAPAPVLKGHRYVVWTAICLTGAILVLSMLSPVLSGYSPVEQNLDNRFVPPGSSVHLLGTDDLGRDVWTRLLYGGRIALTVGAGSVGIAIIGGLVFGVAAGIIGGWVEEVLMLIMDAILSFPTILLAITILAMFPGGVISLTVAIGVVFIPVFARLIRSETRAVITEGYYEASRALGSGILRSMSLHLLPNILPRVLVQASITFALAVVIESSLSFLGLGPPPPSPSWGIMLKDARNFLSYAPWLSLIPGAAIGLTVFGFNLLADALSEMFLD
jgi:peptide/nickel transport system permease protein